MRGDTKIKLPYFTMSATLLVCVFVSGAFSMSHAQKIKKEISSSISSCEMRINNLRRTNDELSVKIAEQENPTRLMKRASTKLIQPNMSESIVWAYENFDGGRVVRSYKKSDNTLSFTLPKRKNLRK